MIIETLITANKINSHKKTQRLKKIAAFFVAVG
jgi:hypothetical protein